MFTDDFIHGECNGRNMYDYDHDGDQYGCDSSRPTSTLLGKIKAETGRAVLFDLMGKSYADDEYRVVGEKWLPVSQIKMSPVQSKYSPDPLPKELEGFVKINAPLWLVNKFKGQYRATIEF